MGEDRGGDGRPGRRRGIAGAWLTARATSVVRSAARHQGHEGEPSRTKDGGSSPRRGRCDSLDARNHHADRSGRMSRGVRLLPKSHFLDDSARGAAVQEPRHRQISVPGHPPRPEQERAALRSESLRLRGPGWHALAERDLGVASRSSHAHAPREHATPGRRRPTETPGAKPPWSAGACSRFRPRSLLREGGTRHRP
jgi:hypothetical protein